MATILIVDDEKNAVKMLAQGLKLEGYDVLTATSGEEALRVCAANHADVVLLDILMPPGMDGLKVLSELKRVQPEVSVVMMSGQKEIETAVRAMELGAKRYLVKPVGLDEILRTIEPFVELARLSRENATLRAHMNAQAKMIGESVGL